MDRFVNNNEFDKNVIYEKLSKLSSELKEEINKEEGERDNERELELIYAQMLAGLRLNTIRPNRSYYF